MVHMDHMLHMKLSEAVCFLCWTLHRNCFTLLSTHTQFPYAQLILSWRIWDMSALLLNMNLEKLHKFNRSSSWRLHWKMEGNSPAWNCCQTGHIILSLGPCHSQNTTNNWFWAFYKHSRFIIHKAGNEDGTSKQPAKVQVISITSVQ